MSMRVVVTGGSGVLGQFVIRELFTHSHGVSSLDLVKPRECVCPTHVVDVEKFAALAPHFEKADALVHLARVRFPYVETGFDPARQRWNFSDPAGDAGRFKQNVAAVSNALAAAEASGIRRVVCGSSLAVYGLCYPAASAQPEYLPVDEEHPRRPQDPYGLTKLVGEQLCDAFAARTGAQVASLRFAGICTEAHRSKLLERRKDPLVRGTGALWSYVDARDAARACRLALEASFSGHQAFNICAPRTIMETPTRELIARYLPGVRDLRPGLDDRRAAYSGAKAREVLRFAPACSLVD